MLPPATSVTLVATNSPCVWKIGARGVQKRGQVVLRAVNRVKLVGLLRGFVGQRSGAVGVQGFNLGPQPFCHRLQRSGLGRVTDHQRRTAVFDKIRQLIRGIGRVQRQEHQTGLRTGGAQRQRLR